MPPHVVEQRLVLVTCRKQAFPGCVITIDCICTNLEADHKARFSTTAKRADILLVHLLCTLCINHVTDILLGISFMNKTIRSFQRFYNFAC